MTHSRARVRLAGLLVVATGASLALATPAAAQPAPGAVPVGKTSTVTLLTGDRVTLGGSPHGVSVHAAKGRAHITFHSYTDARGDMHVIPADATRLVASGRLDPRLFDVSELVRDGYDDAHRKDVPLIVDYPGATPRAAGATVVRELPAVSAVAMRAKKGTAFWSTARSAAKKIWLDGRVRASLDHSVPQIGAPQAWEAGYTGAGTTVAVLDTGIDTTHPDLDDAVTQAKDFTGSETGTDDYFGHGTHVASIVTGSGDASGGKYRGVAPDAKLLNGKVLDDSGGGMESGIIAGMEWAADSGADVISMSLGGLPTDGTDPMDVAVNRITAETGVLFVIAAGNAGPGEQSVSSPGSADAALTVGAVDDNDQLAEFSSRGPRLGDGAIKPDITAPGVGIVAAKAAHGQIGEPAGDGYVSLDGTSMATPHVAGSAAILAGEHPDWTAGQLKSTLMGSAKPNGSLSVFEEGAGRVDVAAAVDDTVSAVPASISAGTALWPHEDDQPIAKTVSYTNSGTEQVTLDLAADMTGPDGAAPAGMFTVEPSQVTVPAGGKTDVTLTIDTKVDAADGQYTGVVAAKSGEGTVRTPVAVNREVESYDITVTVLDHDGKPTPNYWFRFVDIANPKGYVAYDESGTVVARVPKGRFYLDGWVQTQRGETEWLTTDYAEPDYVVDGDAEMVIDARNGKQIAMHVDEPNARTGVANFYMDMRTEWGPTGFSAFGAEFDTVIPSKTSSDRFTYTAEAELAEPDGSGGQYGFLGSPYLYHVRWSKKGSVPENVERTFHDRDLAKVRTDHAIATPGLYGVRDNFLPGKLPFSLTEYYTPDVPWNDTMYEVTDPKDTDAFPDSFNATVVGRIYHKGRVAHERWNVGVFGPAFPTPDYGADYALRLGDEVRLNLPLHADQDPSRDGFGTTATGTTELLRDGETVGKSDSPGYGDFMLPADESTYTLRTTATRDSRLSAVVSGEWTFRSANVPGEEPAALPLLAVRFAPKLNDHNEAPAGHRFRIPVYVQRNGSPDVDGIGTPSVDVSFDDGATWTDAPVSRRGDGWVVTVDHPADAQFVSLRASTSDEDGNAVTQTITRAYALS